MINNTCAEYCKMMNMSAWMLMLVLAIAVGILSCESQEFDNLLDRRGAPPHRHSPPPPHHHSPPPPHHHSPPPPHHHSPPPPHHSPPPPPPQYTHLMLAMQWPPTYCMVRRCPREIPGRFTLHGLWPQHPAYTGSDTLTDPMLSRHRKDLLEYWPDLKARQRDFEKSKEFWKDEYNKHGKNCTSKFSPEEYIARTLALGKAHDIRDYLTRGGIRPDEYRQYDPYVIANAVRNRIHVTPELQCEHNNLLEIRLCFDVNGRNLINCPGGAIGACGHRVKYPPPPPKQGFDGILEMAEDIADIVDEAI